jgi:plasmid stabilization system protein ParE
LGEGSRFAGTRYYLTRDAFADLDEIRRYLDPFPERYTLPIRRGLRSLLQEIAVYPDRGANHSQATRLLGQRALPPYRIFYRNQQGTPEVIAILHMARDVKSILAERLQ